MPRYRKISPVNIEEFKKIASEKKHLINDSNLGEKENVTNNYQEAERNNNSLFKRKKPLRKTSQNRSIQEIVSSTCGNLRGLCGNIRAFADNLDNLLNSVETLVPVVNTLASEYSRSFKYLQEKQKETENTNSTNNNSEEIDNNTDQTIVNNTNENTESDSKIPSSNVNSNINNQDNINLNRKQNYTPKMPSEAELKQFLNNPLVKSLMQALLQQMKPQK
ncbi:MAG: hypothetical protein PWQ67_858 [Clostridia bacterium]|jgi:hypothetical protein|nr:hypothetical protein [Clostridia bacterium]MDN5322404.1 hypothetical protein [Clostridia bacterium]